MSSLTFPIKTAFNLSWTLKDSSGAPINNAVMTASLYAGRSARNPDQIPGTVVSPISSLSLNYVPASAGLYAATVPGTLDPPLDGTGYVLTIDATVSGVQVYHAEQPVVVETAGASIDLTTVELVKGRAEVKSDTDDDEIQSAITGLSRYLLNWSGQGTLNSIITPDEFYDGNGNDKLFTRTWPILSLNFVKLYNTILPISTTPTSWGVYIAQSRRYIGLRGWIGNFTTFPFPNYSVYGGMSQRPVFLKGLGNIEVNYNAGYNDTPEDLEYAVRCVVAINYKRKGWQDQASRTVTGGGTSATTRYRDWEFPPECACVFEHYKRQAIIQ